MNNPQNNNYVLDKICDGILVIFENNPVDGYGLYDIVEENVEEEHIEEVLRSLCVGDFKEAEVALEWFLDNN